MKQAPVKITKQTEDDITVLPGYVASDALKLSVTAQKLIDDDSKTVSYQWKESVNGAVAEDIIEATTDTYTIPTDLAVGSYAYTCAVTCDGYTVTSKPVTFTVKTAVASVTTSDGGTITNYATLADAIATAQLPANSGCTVKLLGAVETTGQIDATAGTFTLDFNGQTWSFNNTTHGKAALYIGGAEVTLNATDGGGIKIDNATNQAYLLKVNGSNSKLTVNGGEYSCGSTANSVIALYADMLTQPGQLTITGGTFVGGGDVNYASALYAYYCGKGTIAIRGGTFKAGSASVLYFNSDASYITTPADLLADGYGYKEGDGWVTYPTAASTAGKTITVVQTPVKITAQPQNKTIYYGYTEATLSLAATAVDISKEFTYQWYSVGTGADGADQVITDATTNTLTIPQGKALGDYQYYCKLTCDGYTLQSSIATVTISQSGTTFDGGIKTYKDSTDTTTFTYGDTITVKVTPKATATVPQPFTLTAPTANQMALFVEGTQITDPKNATDGTELTFTIDTNGKALVAGSNTITAKYVGNDSMADYSDEVTLTLNKKVITSATVNAGATKVYDGTTTFTGVDLTLNTGDVVSGDTVTATADGTSASKD
ncbi:MAG: hypothetical protein PHN80_10220, partial [Hespellia sp.]|nr:hypothetical protein [Hespellia sp.]